MTHGARVGGLPRLLSLAAAGLAAAMLVAATITLGRVDGQAAAAAEVDHIEEQTWALFLEVVERATGQHGQLSPDADGLDIQAARLGEGVAGLAATVPAPFGARIARAWEKGLLPAVEELLRRRPGAPAYAPGAPQMVALEQRSRALLASLSDAHVAAMVQGTDRVRRARTMALAALLLGSLGGLGLAIWDRARARRMRELAAIGARVAGGESSLRCPRTHGPVDAAVAGAIDGLSDALDRRQREHSRFLALTRQLVAIADFDGRFVHLSPGWADTLGYPRAELLARPWSEFVHPDDLEATFSEAGRLMGDGEPSVAFRNRYLTADGSVRHLSWSGQAVRSEQRLYCSAQDITEQVAAEAALARSEEHFRRLLDAVPGPLCVVQDGRITYANESLSLGRGFDSADDLEEQPLELLWGPGQPACIAAVERAATSDEGEVEIGELPLVDPDGRVRTFQLIGRALQLRGGPATICIGHDVTEQRRRRAQLAVAERIGSVGLLASGVAHEVNNPLTFVLGNLRTLAEPDAGLPESLAPLLTEAIDGAEAIGQIVRGLGAFSGVDAEGEVQRCSVVEALQAAARLADNSVRHRARFLQTYEAVDEVMAPSGALAQVFLNLIVNAAQAVPAGDADAHGISVRCFQRGAQVVVEVEDTGVGVAPADRSRLFDPFFTTRPVGEGAGLGLAVCHSIVKRCGGWLEVDSQLGFGSTFRVCLPAAPVLDGAGPAPTDPTPTPGAGGLAATAPTEGPNAETPADSGRPLLLLVDDDLRVGRALARTLRRRFDVDVVSSGHEAQLRLTERRYDGLVCDLMMPGCSGEQLYDWLALRQPAMQQRVLFVTGGAFTPEAQRFLESDVAPCLIKPVEPDALHEAVDALLEGRPGA